MPEPKQYDDDDGRVICDMNVDGMPWHDRQIRREKRAAARAARQPKGELITRSETRRYTFYAMMAGLVIVLIFSVVWILLTLFLTQVWSR